MLEISYDGKKDVLSLGDDDSELTFNPRILDRVDPSLKNFKNQENITHDAGIETDIANNTKNKTMFDYVKLIGSGTSEVFQYLITNNNNLTNVLQINDISDATTQTNHPHLQKIAKILDAAKKAKEAKNNNVDFTDIAIGDKFKISIDTTDENKPKLKIKDTQDTAGEDTFTLDGTTLKYQKNTTENVSRHILLNFEVDGASAKVTQALEDGGVIGKQKAAAELTEAKALLREAINSVLNIDMEELKTYNHDSSTVAKNHIKKILEQAKDEKLADLLNNNGISHELQLDNGKAKIVLKKSGNNTELHIVYDHDETATLTPSAGNTSKFVLENNDVEFTEANDENDKLTDFAKLDQIKDKIEQALNAGTHLNFDTDKITKAKAKADLFKFLKQDLSELLSADKIDNLIGAGTTGIENENLKLILEQVKTSGEEFTATINGVNNKNITLTIKSNGTKIEISADGKKDTITLTGDKFKITTDNKVAKPVLQELAEIKNTLGENPFNAAIEEAKKKIVKEGDHVLTSTEIDNRQAFLDAVYKNDNDNALKTILAAISNQDLTTANTDADILSKIGEAGKDKIKTMLEKAKVVADYVKLLDLTATIGGATVKLEILDNNTPALTIAKDGKTDTFKLSDNNNGQLEYTSAKTSTKDSVLHLLSGFDPTNLNATLSVFIAKNGGEITAKEITAGNIDRIEDTADDKERDL
ncbi:hypothetical protein, partial [Campylobacter pinnipediorum]|uniref:hypothetical protein n=1 Tax=Campylobacter pinnipediorum TaxID=1965231 RepID=UPI00112FA141